MPTKYYSNYDTIGVAGTAQILASGAEATTFTTPVAKLVVLSISHNAYIAKTAALVAAAPGGAEDGRILIQANQHMVEIPWFSENVYFVNVVGGETPTISVIGIP